MYAILTKTIQVTATKPMRIKAYTPDRSVTISWPMNTQTDRDAHFAAALMLVYKYSLRGEWHSCLGGEIKGGCVYSDAGGLKP